jgi:Ca-activated chloride channel homolog
MRRYVLVLAVGLALAGSVQARGILIPVDKSVPPLAMLNHKVDIAINEQVAITRVEQTFRNHTDRPLEATYIFPVPKGASVRKFSMWVNGKETPGELVEAAKAGQIYNSIVQRTRDPGLLEYIGSDLLRVRVFPVPAKGDQKLAVSYTSVAASENGLIEYTYPLKHDGKAISTLEKFAIHVTLKSQFPIQNIYSPTHSITTTRNNEREASITFEKDGAVLDRDFQLYYTAGAGDVGLNGILHRPTSGMPGYFMLLVSPRSELSRSQQAPRDMVFVLDTSGSMRGKRMTQAQNALKYCLGNLNPQDRFAIINFATTVNRYTEKLLEATPQQTDQARKWVDTLDATGGTNIHDALLSALELRPSDEGRTFTIVFFTDGRPTIGVTRLEKILAGVAARNTANTRIFTFGVGDDVNASLLDQLADQTRAVVSYVRENEDIESRVSALYSKISNPVLTNLKLAVGPEVKLSEVYPPQLPDLFHGSQLVVLGRYTGDGKAQVKLTGYVGKDKKEFTYQLPFVNKTSEDKAFVEDLWARRKVGYLLDEIRRNGQKKELVDEVVALAKRYGITTPYTSYLIVPDGPIPVAGPGGRPDVGFHLGALQGGGFGGGFGGNFQGGGSFGGMMGGGGMRIGGGAFLPPGLKPADGKIPLQVADFARANQKQAGEGAAKREALAEKELKQAPKGASESVKDAKVRFESYRRALDELRRGNLYNVQGGNLGVNLSIDSNNLRNAVRQARTAQQWVRDRNLLNLGGVWIDERFDAKMKIVTVKTMSPAYFRILDRHAGARDIFRLGNYLVWVTPSGAALALDANHGLENMTDADIDRLFVAVKK